MMQDRQESTGELSGTPGSGSASSYWFLSRAVTGAPHHHSLTTSLKDQQSNFNGKSMHAFTRTESTNVPVGRISHHDQDWQPGSNCWVQEQIAPWIIAPRVMLERWFTQWGDVGLDMSLDRKLHQQSNLSKRSVELLLQNGHITLDVRPCHHLEGSHIIFEWHHIITWTWTITSWRTKWIEFVFKASTE